MGGLFQVAKVELAKVVLVVLVREVVGDMVEKGAGVGSKEVSQMVEKLMATKHYLVSLAVVVVMLQVLGITPLVVVL
jgi:hypothetical protein